MDLFLTKNIVLLTALIVLYFIEIVFPFFERKGKLRHTFHNLALGLINALLMAVIFGGGLAYVSQLVAYWNIGLLNIITLPLIVEIILAILLFDLWMYAWHVINHKVPFLWRWHKVHHSDVDVDASSAFRFHTGEILLSTLARFIILALLGLELWQLVLYEIILLPIIMFHHSNIAIPERIDKIYRVVFASPRMHWVHHSKIRKETDSNYGSIFSFWDRSFRTFRLRKNPKTIVQGLETFRDPKDQTLWGMIKTGFRK